MDRSRTCSTRPWSASVRSTCPRWASTGRSLVDRHATPPGRGDDSSPPDAFGTRWPHPVLLRNHLLGGTLHRPIDKLEALRLRERDPAVDTRARTVEA
ncbi:hypothetical protein K7G98_37220, partial [Saccharothrix sp. MB29]|nr:hypothetical protein [Saccharothrix sp. MB29]